MPSRWRRQAAVRAQQNRRAPGLPSTMPASSCSAVRVVTGAATGCWVRARATSLRLSSPTTVNTVATAVTTHHHATAAVAHHFARCSLSCHPARSHCPVIAIPSSPSRRHHPVITIPSSPSRRHPIMSSPSRRHHPVVIPPCHHHSVINIPAHHHHRPPVKPTCWVLNPESLRPDATFILELIVTEQTSAQ